MSRTVQVDDSAIITVGDQQFSFPITLIDSSGIHVQNYLLVPIGDQWQVSGYQIPHTIIFLQSFSRLSFARPSFTDIPELDWMILLNLDYQSLSRACQTNMRVNEICQNDSFWKEKMEHDFPSVSQHKPGGITYQEQYRSLIQVRAPHEAAKEGRLDQLIVLEAKGKVPSGYGANLAARNGDLQVLEWLGARNILPSQWGADGAAEGGHLQVLEWLGARNIFPNRFGANEAARNGHLHILEWLASRGILPNQDGANWAAANGHLQVLEWLGVRNILPTRWGVNWASANGHLQVLEWLEVRNILPNQDGANAAARNGHLQVLEWLAARGIYPH